MLKKIALIVLCALPFSLFSQEKLGYINSESIIQLMPEIETIKKTVDELNATWEKELLKMREEYSTKIKEFQEREKTMSEAIREVRITEIQELESRITTTQQTAVANIQKKQQELFTPVIEKVKKAINDVGAEGSFTYIFDTSSQVILYQSPKANDVTPLVKKKLNIK